MMHHADMENSQSQLSSIPLPLENPQTPSPSTPHSDHRHSLVAKRFRDALFSAAAAKYATNDTDHSFPFPSEQLKSNIERCLHEYFPSLHTPTHLPYASMIQKAIAEVGEEDGLSEESISEFIVNEYEDLPWAHLAFLRRHLGKLCESGELVKLKCGKYNFKVEGKGVKRKKRRRKSAGRSRRREVESVDVVENDFDRKKRSKKLIIIGPCAEDAITSKGAEEQNDSLREVIVGVEHGDHAQGCPVMLDELEEVQVDEMMDERHEKEIRYKDGPKDFDSQKQSQNLVIVGLCAPLKRTIKGIEKKSHAKGDQIQVLGEPKKVRTNAMINQYCEKEVKSRDDAQDFDEKKKSQNVADAEDGAEKGGHGQERQVIMIYELKEVKSRDGAKDFGGRKQLQDLVVVGLHAEEAPTTKGIENQCCSLREKIDGDKGNHAQAGKTDVLDKFKEVEMIDVHYEGERQGEVMENRTESAYMRSNEEDGPSEEATLEFFDALSNNGNTEENEAIDAQACKRLQEENEILEFFDAKSDHGDNEVNEMIGAESSKGKILGVVSNKENGLQKQLLYKVSDDQSRIGEGLRVEDLQLSKEHPQVRWPSEITGTPSTSIATSPPLEHQIETLKHAKKGMLNTYEADKNENAMALLPSVIICSPNSQPRGRRGRGRPRKLKVQETLATLFSSSAQDCDQKHLESNVEDRETFGPNTGDGTHHVDQQQVKPPRGRGRGRGRPRVVRQDSISASETFSPSKHLSHQQYPEKRRRGRPPKRKFDEDTVSKDISTFLENEQQE